MHTFRPLILSALLCAAVTLAGAAPLDVTPDTLIARANLLRDARDRPWDPATGRLGNLRHVRIVADDCTVRVVSGGENRLILGRGSFGVTEDTHGTSRQEGPRPLVRDVAITTGPSASIPRVGPDNGAVCFTLQLATAHELTVGGNRLTLLFDRVELPALRMFLNPSADLRVWFNDVRLGLLSVKSNASATGGGTGQVEWLQLDSSQGSTALLFHDMNARHIGVSATTTGARFSIRIGKDTDAGYYQPARAAGALARLYPIWIDGPVAALKIPAGNVDAMPITSLQRDQTRALREDVMGRAGPMPVLPVLPALQASDRALPPSTQSLDAEPVSPRQRVSDVLQPRLPPGVTLGKVDLWKNGGALEGRAPDDATVRQFVNELNRSGEVRNAQVAVVRKDADRVAYRVLVTFMCAAPGERSVCLPATGGAYTGQQVEDALRPVLGNDVTLSRLTLREGSMVELEGLGSDADARAALDRIRKQVPWLEASISGYGKGTFSARLRMVCTVPQRAAGICSAPVSPR